MALHELRRTQTAQQRQGLKDIHGLTSIQGSGGIA